MVAVTKCKHFGIPQTFSHLNPPYYLEKFGLSKEQPSSMVSKN